MNKTIIFEAIRVAKSFAIDFTKMLFLSYLRDQMSKGDYFVNRKSSTCDYYCLLWYRFAWYGCELYSMFYTFFFFIHKNFIQIDFEANQR